MKRIVLTGGTYVGKTSIINYLKKEGYTTFESVAEKNMRLLIDLLGFEVYKKRRKDHYLEFQEMVFFSNLQAYNDSLKITDPKEGFVFYDRGIFDWFAALRRENIEIPVSLIKQSEAVHYDKIFLVEGIPTHKIVLEAGKLLDEKHSKEWEKFLIAEYERIYGEITKIPSVYYEDDMGKGVKERVEFLLSNLREE